MFEISFQKWPTLQDLSKASLEVRRMHNMSLRIHLFSIFSLLCWYRANMFWSTTKPLLVTKSQKTIFFIFSHKTFQSYCFSNQPAYGLCYWFYSCPVVIIIIIILSNHYVGLLIGFSRVLWLLLLLFVICYYYYYLFFVSHFC